MRYKIHRGKYINALMFPDNSFKLGVWHDFMEGRKLIKLVIK